MSKIENEILLELERLEEGLITIPKMFGIDRQSYSSNFDYGKGKLRFDSWLKRWTNFLAKYVQDSDREISELKHRYDDNNCMPSGSGYGSKSNMVMTVFVKPFIDRVELIQEEIENGFFILPELSSLNGVKYDYVSNERVLEIEELDCEFDTSKLTQLLKEINIAHRNEAYLTIAMVQRAILDHIPPIFGYEKFKEIANNYSGTRSFKEAMKGLDDQMRKISDSCLHQTIRKSEVLPTFQQVDIRNTLDLLLAEIIRSQKNA